MSTGPLVILLLQYTVDSGPRSMQNSKPSPHLPHTAHTHVLLFWFDLAWHLGTEGGSGSQDFNKSLKGHHDFQRRALSGDGREDSCPRSLAQIFPMWHQTKILCFVLKQRPV